MTSTSSPTAASPPGETSLSTLLATLKPTLHPTTFVFLNFPHSPPSAAPPPTLLSSAQMIFREAEGTTLITTLDSAKEHGLTDTDYTFPCRMITCEGKPYHISKTLAMPFPSSSKLLDLSRERSSLVASCIYTALEIFETEILTAECA